MFEPNSRYFLVETAELQRPDGETVVYVRRRFLPLGSAMPLLAEVELTEGDRLDLITARTLGDPEQFWRVADGNDALDPAELTAEIGRWLRVPIPQF